MLPELPHRNEDISFIYFIHSLDKYMLSTIIWQVLCCHKEHSMMITVFVTPWTVWCDSNISAAPWTVARQAPLSMGFSRQEHWSGLPCPPPGDLSNPGIRPRSSHIAADSLPSEPPGKSDNDSHDAINNSCMN